MQCFKDQLFLVTHILLYAHTNVYIFGNILDNKCVNLFPKYGTEIHFLIENEVHIYKEENMSTKDLYQKNWLMSIINDPFYLRVEFPKMRLTINVRDASLIPNW